MTLPLALLAVATLLATFAFTAVEESLRVCSASRAEQMVADRLRGARRLITILQDPPPYLSVVAFLRVATSQAATVFIAFAIVSAVPGTWVPLALAIAVVTVISFALVGVSPRTLGRQHAPTIARISAPTVIWLRRVFGVVSRLLVLIANAVTPGRGYREGPFETESDLRGLVDLAGDNSVIDDEERDMIHSVFELGDTLAREVMVPRIDIVTINDDRVARQAMNLFLRSGFSRIPVVGESQDDVRGLLYLKDVARVLSKDPNAVTRPITEMMRSMSYVPESKPVADLLKDMQREQNHFAVVVDEYGGTAGVVTMEDIVEEIVGEITDEFDRETPEPEELGNGRYRVAASLSIQDLGDLFDLDLDDDEVSTVGGLLAKAIGKVPIMGAEADVEGLHLVAEKMAGRRHRLATVVVTRAEPVDDGTAEASRADDEVARA